jgi:hypothetical protein
MPPFRFSLCEEVWVGSCSHLLHLHHRPHLIYIFSCDSIFNQMRGKQALVGVDLEVSTACFLLVSETSRAVSQVCPRVTHAASSLVVLFILGQCGISRGRVGGTENATCEN